jgi:hypothetical protein
MADEIKKTVITEFKADTKQYEKAMKDAEKSTDKVTEAQEELQDQSKETGKAITQTMGDSAEGIGKLIPGLGGVTGGFKSALEGAQKFGLGTKAAIAATGVGLLVVAIGTLVTKFKEVGEVAEDELSYTQKKFKDLGTGVTNFFKGLGEGLTNWMKNNQAIIDNLMRIANIFSFGLAGKVVEFTKEVVAEAAAHEANKEAIIAENAARAQAVTDIQNQITLAQARGVEESKILDMQLKRIEAQKLVKDADVAALEVERQVIEIKKERLAQLQLETDLNIRLAQAKAVTEVETIKNADLVSMSMDEINQKLRERITLTGQQASQEKQLADIEAGNIALKLDAQSKMNTLIQATMIWQKANAAKSAFISGKEAIMAIWAQKAVPWPLKLAQSIAMGVITAKQIKDIVGVQFTAPAFADGGQVPGKRGGMITGRSHKSGGVKFAIGGYAAEAEGGEFIVNRRATANFLPMLKAINETGLKKYETGGMVDPTSVSSLAMQAQSSSQRSVLVIEDYRTASNRLEVIESLASL